MKPLPVFEIMTDKRHLTAGIYILTAAIQRCRGYHQYNPSGYKTMYALPFTKQPTKQFRICLTPYDEENAAWHKECNQQQAIKSCAPYKPY